MKKSILVYLMIAVAALFLTGGCSNSESGAEIMLSDYPHFVEIPLIRQGTTYSCGIASMHSLLRWASYNLDINDEHLMEACGTTKESGTAYQRLLSYMQETGQLDAEWKEKMTLEEVKNTIDAGGVVMMPIQAWESKNDSAGESTAFETDDYKDYWAAGHWVIACGYNDRSVLFMDPSTAGCYTQMPWGALDMRWHDSPDYEDGSTTFTKYEHCGLVIYKLGSEKYDPKVVKPLG